MEKKKNKYRLLIWITAGLFALVFAFSGVMLAREVILAKNEASKFEALASARPRREGRTSMPKTGAQSSGGETTVSQDMETPVDQGTETEAGRSAIIAENQRLHEMNPDFFAWISIPDTVIDYPVMYAPNRKDFYLRHDFYEQEAMTGVPYLDEKCDPYGSYYLVYGHRPALETMFYHLVDFKDRSFWETHQTVYFDTLHEERTYVVVAAFKARVLDKSEREGFRYYNYKSLDTMDIFDEYMRQVRENQLYDTGIDVSFGDEILVLSTCYKYTTLGRFVVVAKRVD